MPASYAPHLTAKTLPRQISVGSASIDGLKEGRGLEHVNRLRYLRLDKLLFVRGQGCLVFGDLVVRWRSVLRILILICQEIPPGLSQTNSKVTGAAPSLRVSEANYGRASIFTYILKLPVCWIPTRNCTLMLAPLASGVPSVTVPALRVLLKPPPLGCDGGCSSVVPCTVAVQGGVAGAPVAAHVTVSLIPATTTALEVRGLRSAIPDGAGKVVRSITRKRNRVTAAPVLFTNLLRIERVPNVELFAGSLVKSRTRFGGLLLVTVASSKFSVIVLLR